MPIKVEFFGVARLKTKVAHSDIDIAGDSIRLNELLETLGSQFPALTPECIRNGYLNPAFVANLNGDLFITNPETRIEDGQNLIIMSADAGG